MGNLQIKDLPADLHDRLRKRAAEAGMTQRDYVLKLIERDLRLPSRQEWLRRIREHPPVRDADGAALVRESRAAREAELDARADECFGEPPP